MPEVPAVFVGTVTLPDPEPIDILRVPGRAELLSGPGNEYTELQWYYEDPPRGIRHFLAGLVAHFLHKHLSVYVPAPTSIDANGRHHVMDLYPVRASDGKGNIKFDRASVIVLRTSDLVFQSQRNGRFYRLDVDEQQRIVAVPYVQQPDLES